MRRLPRPATDAIACVPRRKRRCSADLYYNQYRDYDPTTGRYIQADPIGLAGDENPYSYANSNPVGMVDPEGLTFTEVTTSPAFQTAGRIIARTPPGRLGWILGTLARQAVNNCNNEDDDICVRKRREVDAAIRQVQRRAREYDADVNQEETTNPNARLRHFQSRGQAINRLANAVRRAKFHNCLYNSEADRLLMMYPGHP